VLPSGRTAKIARIVTWDGDLSEAHAPQSVTLVLDREVDISRGYLLVAEDAPATIARSVKAALVWMDAKPLELGRRYLLKHTSHTVPAVVQSLDHRTDIGTLTGEPAVTLEMNGIGVANLTLLRPIALDAYRESRATGAFILIDPETNATVASGMVNAASGETGRAETLGASGPVSLAEGAARWGHKGGALELTGSPDLIDRIERRLFAQGLATTRIEKDDAAFSDPGWLAAIVRWNVQSGLLALVVTQAESGRLTAKAGGEEVIVNANELDAAFNAVQALLQRAGIVTRQESGDGDGL